MTAVPDTDHFIKLHQGDVWRYLRVLGADHDMADDLTQETFLAVLRSSFERRGELQTRAYLRTTARNLFLMAIRRRKNAPLPVDAATIDVDWESFAGDDGGEAKLDALRKCLATLDERDLRALEMRYRDDAPRERMGKALELSDGGVKNLLERLKTRLRACVENTLRQWDRRAP